MNREKRPPLPHCPARHAARIARSYATLDYKRFQVTFADEHMLIVNAMSVEAVLTDDAVLDCCRAYDTFVRAVAVTFDDYR
jgi:hypothetical protein